MTLKLWTFAVLGLALAAPAGAQPRADGLIRAADAAAATGCGVNTLPEPFPMGHAEALAAFPDRARVEGRVLRIGRFKLDQGDPPEIEDERLYSYAGPYGDFGLDLVVVRHFDSIGWLLLDQRSGRRLNVAAVPIAAPDGRRFLFVEPWETADKGGLKIRERTAAGWRTLASIRLNRPCGLRWLPDGSVAYRERSGYGSYTGGPEKIWRP